jgi:hypothetical protein
MPDLARPSIRTSVVFIAWEFCWTLGFLIPFRVVHSKDETHLFVFSQSPIFPPPSGSWYSCSRVGDVWISGRVCIVDMENK